MKYREKGIKTDKKYKVVKRFGRVRVIEIK